jgi:hypothetical protein
MNRMKRALVALVAMIGAATAAEASIIINANALNTSFNVNYLGLVGGTSTSNVTAAGSFMFTGVTNNNLTYNFNYSLLNNSIYDSRLSSFGFNVVSGATIAAVSSTGYYSYANQNQNYPEGVGTIETCYSPENNGTCTGNGGGLTSNPDQTGTGTLSITLASAMASLTLDDFVTRFQAINPTVNGSNSGVGIGTIQDISGPVSAAPEPATWAMMLIGFGFIGFALRRPRISPAFPVMIAAAA